MKKLIVKSINNIFEAKNDNFELLHKIDSLTYYSSDKSYTNDRKWTKQQNKKRYKPLYVEYENYMLEIGNMYGAQDIEKIIEIKHNNVSKQIPSIIKQLKGLK